MFEIPDKYKTLQQKVGYMAGIGSTQEEIAVFLNLSPEQLQSEFAAEVKMEATKYRLGLRAKIHDRLDKVSAATIAWLFRQQDKENPRQLQAALRPFRKLTGEQLDHIARSQPAKYAQCVHEREIRLMERDLAAFFRAAWPVICPGRELIWSWHYDLLCEYLTLVKQREVRRLIVNVPPRTAKSTLATICFPVWVWLTQPEHNFLCASYAKELSTDHSLVRRQLLSSEWFQNRWGGDFAVGQGQDVKNQFDNSRRGQMIATSVGATVTGRGGDTLIVDDPVSATQALSDAERSGANTWFDNTLRSRLNDPASGAIVVIMQRLHQQDLTGYLLETEPQEWTLVRIPLEAESGESEVRSQEAGENRQNIHRRIPDSDSCLLAPDSSPAGERWVYPITGKVHERCPGEVLQPERFTPKVVDGLKSHHLVWAGQYQQRPAPLEGNLIKRSFVRYYGGVDPMTGEPDEQKPERFDCEVISVDCAFKDTPTSDFVCIGYIGMKGNRRYVFDVVNAHLNIMATEKAIWQMMEDNRWSKSEVVNGHRLRTINAILIEDAANGPAIIQRLNQVLPCIIPITPEGGKMSRFMAAQPEWEAGEWYVDRNAAWTGPFIEQLTMFPNAKHDDMCDMMSQASAYLKRYFSLPPIVQYWKMLANEPRVAPDYLGIKAPLDLEHYRIP